MISRRTPDRFQGKKSCMVGVFSHIIHEGVSWDKSAAMISQEVHRNSDRPDRPRIETRPVKFGWKEEGKEKSVTLVAVYAAVDIIAEVKGTCMQLAFEQTDDTGLGLLDSHTANIGSENFRSFPKFSEHFQNTFRNFQIFSE